MSVASSVLKESLLFVGKQVPGVKMVTEFLEAADKVNDRRNIQQIEETQEALLSEIADIRTKLDEALRSGSAQKQTILDLNQKQADLTEQLLEGQTQQHSKPRAITKEEQDILGAVTTLHQIQATTRDQIAAMKVMLESHSLTFLNLINPKHREIMAEAPGSYGDLVEIPMQGKINLLLPSKKILAIPPATFEHMCNKRENTDIKGDPVDDSHLLIKDKSLQQMEQKEERSAKKSQPHSKPRPIQKPTKNPIYQEIRNGDCSRAPELTELPAEIAEHLSRHDGTLYLDNLTTLSDIAAEHLSRHIGTLHINGLKTLSNVAAKHLAKHRGWLSLNSLTSLSDKAAEHLAKHHGKITANKSIKKQINKFKGWKRFFT